MDAIRNKQGERTLKAGRDKEESLTDADAPQVLERLVREAEQAGASDLHLHMTEAGARMAWRLDGVMVPKGLLPGALAERLFGRIKYLAELKTYQESFPQEGRIAKERLGTKHDVRVATYPTVTGEKVVLRLFQAAVPRTLVELGLPEAARRELERFLRQWSGLLLLTGPAGSGKTTTIYACLRHLTELGGRHIITVEDPVEQVLPEVMQTEVNEARGLTFAEAARHLLRQDPQVLVIGEIRDEETAGIVVRAALTGHLVISTLHAGSCQGVLERLLTLCPDRFAVAAAVELIFNQRLMRRVCSECGGQGCDRCAQTGYRGRVPVVEWVRLTEPLRRRLREEGPPAIAPVESLAEAARARVQEGLTNAAEYERMFGA